MRSGERWQEREEKRADGEWASRLASGADRRWNLPACSQWYAVAHVRRPQRDVLDNWKSSAQTEVEVRQETKK